MKQKIGIIAAADDEIQPLIAQMRIEKTEETAMLKLIEGTWQGQSITAVRCGVGKVKDGCLISTGGARPGMDILVTKWIGIEGTSIIAKEKETELKTKFSVPFVEKAKALDAYISVQSEAAVAVKSGVSAMHDVTEGGIFGALWEMAEASGVGLEIDLKKIPIRQETIEVCEFFGINPYQLISSGCMLMAAEDGNLLVRELEKAGIPATIIGKATAGNDRVLLNEEERRFLEPPKADELYKAI